LGKGDFFLVKIYNPPIFYILGKGDIFYYHGENLLSSGFYIFITENIFYYHGENLLFYDILYFHHRKYFLSYLKIQKI